MERLELAWGTATHIGARDENQDRFLAVPPLFAVADGMGGHAAGAQASEVAVRRLTEVANGIPIAVETLREALRQADAEIAAIQTGRAGSSGAGTTVVGLALIENEEGAAWAVFHVGDSRIYRWSAVSWEQVGTDHSVVQELVDGGLLTAEQAAHHPQRHMITRALGFGSRAELDVTVLPVICGERFLICSDGLTNELSDQRIRELVSGPVTPQEAADQLAAEAVEAGGRDNVTVVLVHVSGDAALGVEAAGVLDEATVHGYSALTSPPTRGRRNDDTDGGALSLPPGRPA